MADPVAQPNLSLPLQILGNDHVTSWLQQVTDGQSPPGIEQESNIREEDTPRTPEKVRQTLKNLQEVSPTDTCFSDASIFDSQPFYHTAQQYRSPDGEDDRYSDITSVTTQDERFEPNIDHHEDTVRCMPPLNEQLHELKHAGSHTDHAPSPCPTARLVSIISCLQCTLANLPCSRTPPTCSRCSRNASGPCLLYRRRFVSELHAGYIPEPILLKLPGEDDGVWVEKLRRHEELYQQWVEQQDRKNWVYPAVDREIRGGCRIWVLGPNKTSPGEGIGRLVYREMVVEEEKGD